MTKVPHATAEPRRRFLSHVGSWGLLGLAGCASGVGEQSGIGAGSGEVPAPPPRPRPTNQLDFSQPWNAPQNLDLYGAHTNWPRGRQFGSASGYDLSLSPDGRHLAMALPHKPHNEIDILDVATGRAWVLRHPDPLIGVFAPTFAPNGELALICRPPAFRGVGEVWITDAEGKPAEVIGADDRPRTFMKPSFAPDSRKFLCMRDVYDPRLALTAAPEWRQSVFFALFEVDRQTRSETQVLDFVANESARGFYSANPDVLYGTRLRPSDPIRAVPGAWMSSTPTREYDAVMWSRRQPFGSPPATLPAALEAAALPGIYGSARDRYLNLNDVTSEGDVFYEALFTSQSDQANFEWRRFLAQKDQLIRFDVVSFSPDHTSISADGRTVAGMLNEMTDNDRQRVSDSLEYLKIIVVGRDQSRRVFTRQSITWQTRSIPLVPAQTTRLIR